ncbi:MAG: hypothetical protein JWO06_1281 [Bacteroidota bacterium]|nr:hypothetical protein [Bacteroidota bacterium]
MNKNILLVFIALLCFISADLAGQSTSYSFTYGGISRSYLVYLPTNFNSSTSLPLVLNLHGLGSNGQQQELYTLFDDLADTARCVVVYPEGINGQWNVVVNCTGSNSPCTGIDDVGFISALIDTIHKNYNIDLSRVYSTGMSDGGFMTFRLACELSCRIAAGAAVTGLLQEAYPLYPQCNPTRKMPMMQFHGTADSTVPYTNSPPYASVANTTTRWKAIDACPSTAVVTNLPDINNSDGCTATENYYGVCGDSTLFVQYTINGGGHTWPDANPLANIGVTNRDINANSLIWNFFKHYSTPANISITGLANTYCTNANAVTLTGSPAGGTFAGSGVSGGQFNPATAGAGAHTITYSLTWRGCTYISSQSVTVSICTDVQEQTMFEGLSVYPNPANNQLNIKLGLVEGPLKVALYDITGRDILNQNFENSDHADLAINTANIPNGIYFIKLETANHSALRKVVISR